MKTIGITIALVVVVIIAGFVWLKSPFSPFTSKNLPTPNVKVPLAAENKINELTTSDPLTIESMRMRSYNGSDIKIEETLASGTNYKRYIASFDSDGFKMYGLYTVPNTIPEGGAPAIVFIHGHLDPGSYKTTERYVAYQDGFAKSGYITFKPDLRGHGRSEGEDVNSNFSSVYIADALNTLGSLKRNSNVNKDRIGMWGHSMGGGITLRSMVVSKDIKAGVIWAGVVGDYEDLLERYRKRIPWVPSAFNPTATSGANAAWFSYVEKYGSPSGGNLFWKAIDPYSYLNDISGPIELHHGTLDDSVPLEFSQHLRDALKAAGKEVSYYDYPGSDHNISQGFSVAMQRSITFFDKYLKP